MNETRIEFLAIVFAKGFGIDVQGGRDIDLAKAPASQFFDQFALLWGCWGGRVAASRRIGLRGIERDGLHSNDLV